MAAQPAPRYTIAMSEPPIAAILRRRALWVAAVVVLATLLGNWLFGGDSRPLPRCLPREQILAAIRFVESSDRADVPDGDDGKAIGPYQIHEEYWRDALEAEPAIGGGYQDCRSRAYAERVIAAYMQHYVPAAWMAGEAEVVARVHNGGPTGYRSPATLGYWQRVQSRLLLMVR